MHLTQPQAPKQIIGRSIHFIRVTIPLNHSQLEAQQPTIEKPQLETLNLKFSAQAEIFRK